MPDLILDLVKSTVSERMDIDRKIENQFRALFPLMPLNDVDLALRFMPWMGKRGLYETWWENREEFVSNALFDCNGDTFHTEEGDCRKWRITMELMRPYVDVDKGYNGNSKGIRGTLNMLTEVKKRFPWV